MSLLKLIMLDESSLGPAPLLVYDIFNMVKRINKVGVTVFLVEQNVKQTLGMCHRAHVLENGRSNGYLWGNRLFAAKDILTSTLNYNINTRPWNTGLFSN
jgi:ABC-type branched-subunit amino acid transport system ATPase component